MTPPSTPAVFKYFNIYIIEVFKGQKSRFFVLKSIFVFQKWTKKMSDFEKRRYFLAKGFPPYDN